MHFRSADTYVDKVTQLMGRCCRYAGILWSPSAVEIGWQGHLHLFQGTAMGVVPAIKASYILIPSGRPDLADSRYRKCPAVIRAGCCGGVLRSDCLSSFFKRPHCDWLIDEAAVWNWSSEWLRKRS